MIQRLVRRRWTAIAAGWLFALIVSLYIAIPWVAETLSRWMPVYASPWNVEVRCEDGRIVLQGMSTKLDDFSVALDEDPGYLRIEWQFGDLPQTNTVPLIPPDGAFVPTRPTFVVGDDFVVGPFVIPRPPQPGGAIVHVVLPGYRFFGLYRTTAEIGPILIPPCP